MSNFKDKQKTGIEVCNKLIEKSWEDSQFKNQFIENPYKVFKNETGVEFPKSHKLIVEDQSDKSVIYINIPSRPNIDEMELSDEQLEMVSGGGTPVIGVAAVCVGGVLAVGAVLFVGAAVVGYYANKED